MVRDRMRIMGRVRAGVRVHGQGRWDEGLWNDGLGVKVIL
jgi:hypothetical protein